MTLDLSLGEFSALTTKALRGAGYQWGIATDGAYAACVLAQAGLPAAEIVVRLLDQVANRAATDSTGAPGEYLSPNALCPLILSAALSDLGEAVYEQAPTLLASQSVVEPLLVAPALQRSAIHWDGGHVDVFSDHVRLIGDLPQGATVIRIERLNAAARDVSVRRTRAAVDAGSHAVLLKWAQRTYAPATEASRAGAGASTADND